MSGVIFSVERRDLCELTDQAASANRLNYNIEYRLPSFYRDPNAPKITAKVNMQGATSMANRIISGSPGFDPQFTPKNGGSMFFNSKGNAWAGLKADQTITVEVSVKIPENTVILNDHDLFNFEVDIAIDDFEKEGAKIKGNDVLTAKFKDAYYDYVIGINKNGKYDVKDFTAKLKASDLNISNSTLKRLLAPKGHHASIRGRMWTKVGEWVFQSTPGVGRVQMAENGISPYAAEPSEYVVVKDPANVSIVGGDAAFVDQLVEAGAKTSSPESKEIFRRQKVAKVRAVFRVGGRILLVVAIAQDIYSFYKAEDKLKEITRIAGGWTGAYLAGSAAAALFAPADTAGPVAWVLHGLVVLIASGVGYIAGSEFTGWVYELTIEDEGW
ncbi:MAG: transglutaminase-like protease [Bacteroidetes bacterium]|nr:MAG: transglutaminase-like protease [Bacteroidota bacterium]